VIYVLLSLAVIVMVLAGGTVSLFHRRSP